MYMTPRKYYIYQIILKYTGLTAMYNIAEYNIKDVSDICYQSYQAKVYEDCAMIHRKMLRFQAVIKTKDLRQFRTIVPFIVHLMSFLMINSFLIIIHHPSTVCVSFKRTSLFTFDLYTMWATIGLFAVCTYIALHFRIQVTSLYLRC